jgi:hypothetical protein
MATNGDLPRFAAMEPTQKGRATERVRNNCRFDEFAELQGTHPLSDYTMETVQERDRNGKLLLEQTFSEYATFVMQLTYVKAGMVKSHAVGTMVKFFSTPYDTLAKTFPTLAIFRAKDHANKWWTDLYNNFKYKVRAACITRGEEIEENAKAIRYPELCNIGAELLAKGSGPEVEAYVALAFQRQACGRPGELGFLNFNTCDWKNGGLEAPWGNRKDGRQQRMIFYPDNRGFMLDPYHALGCQILVVTGLRQFE